MIRKAKPTGKRATRAVPVGGAGRQSIARIPLLDEEEGGREEVDTDFDAVDIDDVVRQARNGLINISELDAF